MTRAAIVAARDEGNALRGIKWSKLKKQLEQRICDPLKGRVEFFLTNYRTRLGHEAETRFWITVDGEEVFSASRLRWLIEYGSLANQIREINKCTDFRSPEQREGYYRAYDDAEKILRKRGLIDDYEFGKSLKKYLSLPFDEALKSNNPVFKALAIIDGRLGKRRLQELSIQKNEHQLILRLYKLRCEVEGIDLQ
ncbi:MAG: hypothetical protein K6U03_04120 [Firmicutes bacterium]|nr:hypothetical protein [Bacillota bacterium]